MIQPDERGAEVGGALVGVEIPAQEPARLTEQRDRLKHTLGNLTLVAGSLNPALSRSAWEVKKAELLRCGQPGLSRELHEVEDWAKHMERLWNDRFDRLEQLLKEEEAETPKVRRRKETFHGKAR